MSRRKRSAAPAREPKGVRESKGKGREVVPSSDAADLEAAAEMLEAAVVRETEALREEEAMRQAEESLAAILDSDMGEGTGAEEVASVDEQSQPEEAAGVDAQARADDPANADANAEDPSSWTSAPAEAEAEAEAPAEMQAPDEPEDEPGETRDPYSVLADYERRSFAHVVASADQVQAPGLWRGIAFRIGSRRLMSSITEVSEILPVLHHTSVPGTQPWLLGVVNVRGTLVPLVDLRGYIEGERTPLGDTSRMLVARHGSNAIGLLVEEVLGQRNLTAENDPLKLENDAANWARFVPAHFDLDGKLWGVFSMAALVAAPDFLHAAA